MNMIKYQALYRAEIKLRQKLLYEKNQEKREHMQKSLDRVVEEMVKIENQLRAEYEAFIERSK